MQPGEGKRSSTGKYHEARMQQRLGQSIRKVPVLENTALALPPIMAEASVAAEMCCGGITSAQAMKHAA